MENNTWNECEIDETTMHLISDLDGCPPSVCYDMQSKQLYLLNLNEKYGKMMIFDMEEKKINQYECPEFSSSANAICMDGVCHIIGGHDRRELRFEGYNEIETNLHQIWNHETKESETIHTFDQYPNGFNQSGLIYISNQRELLLLGGYKHDYDYSKFRLDTIYKYSLTNRKWTELDIKLPYDLCDFGCVITKDQRHVIIMGGKATDDDGHQYMCMENIFILDVMKMTIGESKITLPFNRCKAIIMENKIENELLVNGFIRKETDLGKMNIPIAIISLCAGFHVVEYIHILHYNGGHWKINVKKILDNEDVDA